MLTGSRRRALRPQAARTPTPRLNPVFCLGQARVERSCLGVPSQVACALSAACALGPHRCTEFRSLVGSSRSSTAAASSDLNSSTGRRVSLTKWPKSLAMLDALRGPKTTSARSPKIINSCGPMPKTPSPRPTGSSRRGRGPPGRRPPTRRRCCPCDRPAPPRACRSRQMRARH